MSGTSDPKMPGARRPDAKNADAQVPEAKPSEAKPSEAKPSEVKAPATKPSEARTPGALIAEARKKRGLSADDLAERTKIPVTLLVALEADEYHRLSGPLYARSFLRSCAKELGLPVEDVLDLYSRHSGETVRAPGEPPLVASAVRIKRVGLPWARLAVGFVAVAGLAVLSFVLTRPDGGEADSQAAVTAQPVTRAAVPSVRGERAAGARTGGAGGCSGGFAACRAARAGVRRRDDLASGRAAAVGFACSRQGPARWRRVLCRCGVARGRGGSGGSRGGHRGRKRLCDADRVRGLLGCGGAVEPGARRRGWC
ncbi:MAG: helix-turn-helix domain-containing protein [bacterium]|nr:helix-turn-helix domain-containing protein [bacterium]